ncbi:hypothetical protein VPH35_102501 [Triticum aestivum]
MTSMSTSSTRRRKDHDGELARRTPAIHFVMLELEDGGVAPIGDAADVYIVKLEPGGVELAEILPCAAEEGETEHARTTPVFFFMKPVPWRTKSWRLATLAPRCHGG